MFWRRLFLLVLLLGASSVAPAQDLSADEWRALLLADELPKLQTTLTDPDAKRLAFLLQQGIEDTENADFRLASLRYLALTNHLAVAEFRPGKALALQLIQSLVGKTEWSPALEDEVLAKLKAIETLARAAHDEASAAVRRQTLLRVVLQLESLARYSPPASRYLEAAAMLRRNLREGDDARAALLLAFGVTAEELSPHLLLHYLQIKLLALGVAHASGVPEAESHALATAAELLGSGNDFEAQAKLLHERCLGAIQRHGLDTNESLMLSVAPEKVQERSVETLSGLAEWLPRVREALYERETFLQSLWPGSRAPFLSLLGRLQDRLESAAKRLEGNSRFDVLENLLRAIPTVQALLVNAANAIVERSAASESYIVTFERALENLLAGERLFSAGQTTSLNAAISHETSEAIRRAWFNRHNAAIAALSVLLAAEAISIPFSGGSTAPAIPATLHLIGTLTVASAKTIVLTNAALNIADRTKYQGVQGLANMDTAFDALVLLGASPRPTPGAPAAAGVLGRARQYAGRKLAQFQYSSASLLTITGAGYASYLLANAEGISQELEVEGILVSPSEIRRKALVYGALAILSGSTNANYYARGKGIHGKKFQEEINAATVTGTLERSISRFRQVRSVKQSYEKHPGVWGLTTAAAKTSGFLALDYLLITAGGLMSYVTPDSTYLNHIQKHYPLPTLQGDEIAVVAIGFEPSDYFLYAGALADYSNLREIHHFGNRLRYLTFVSPDDLMAQLEHYARESGPVKYLKISTHGRPGRLFTPAVNQPEDAAFSRTRGDGFIAPEWFQANEVSLREKSRTIFPPGARIVLWACLVGANLDRDVGEGTDPGDRFTYWVGRTWLANGGALDSSRRVLLGAEATVGSLGHFAHANSLRGQVTSLPDLHVTLPLFPLRGWHEEMSQEREPQAAVLPLVPAAPTPFVLAPPSKGIVRRKPESDQVTSFTQTGQTMGNRVVGIYSRWPTVWWEYGVNLEGPFWSSRYRHDEFEPFEDKWEQRQ